MEATAGAPGSEADRNPGTGVLVAVDDRVWSRIAGSRAAEAVDLVLAVGSDQLVPGRRSGRTVDQRPDAATGDLSDLADLVAGVLEHMSGPATDAPSVLLVDDPLEARRVASLVECLVRERSTGRQVNDR